MASALDSMLSSPKVKVKVKVSPEPILMKLGMVDYVWDPTPHDNFGGGSAAWVVWANVIYYILSRVQRQIDYRGHY